MSWNPHGLGAFSPTGCGLSSELPRCQAMESSSPYVAPEVPARHAYSHSASVGKRYSQSLLRMPAARSIAVSLAQNSAACCHQTESTGASLAVGWSGGLYSAQEWEAYLGHVITRSYCLCVTGVAPR